MLDPLCERTDPKDMDMFLVTLVVTKPCQPLWAGDLSRQGPFLF
jgi:hypothetical protein